MSKPSLFDKAKKSAPAKSAKKAKDEVVINSEKAFKAVKRLEELKKQKAEIEAEEKIVYGTVRTLGVEAFNKKYEDEKKFTDSFQILVTDAADASSVNVKTKTGGFMFAPTDKYIKIDADRAAFLTNKYGEDVVNEETTYKFDNDMLEKYGAIISKLIENSTEIAEADKDKLIKAETSLAVKKGTIKTFRSNDMMRKFPLPELTNDFLPIFQVKNVKVETEEAA